VNEIEEMKLLQEIDGPGIIGVDELEKFLGVPTHRTTKTLIFETEK
jgi:hypothetical protein